jgi:hypothetical protein
MEYGFDAATLREALAGPESDTRQWCSYGVVSLADTDGEEQSIIEYDPDHGPLVSVVLQPSGLHVTCRVGSMSAGNGEGSWDPFVKGDEVMVLIPEGDERAGCVIVSRLNNRFAKFPGTVAGSDVTKNNFAWRRRRTPYVEEVAGPMVLRHATTGAFFGFDATGQITVSNGDKAALFLRSDMLSLQNADADVLMQVDVSKKQIVMEANGTKFVLDKDQSSLVTQGTFSIASNGNSSSWHLATVEGVINLLVNFFVGLGAALPVPIPISTIISAVVIPGINGCVDQTTGVLSPAVTTALQAAFGKQGSPPYSVPDPTGLWQSLHPGVGNATFLIG